MLRNSMDNYLDMKKFTSWGYSRYPYFPGVMGIQTIGYMLQYLTEIHSIKSFEFNNMTVMQIYNLLYDSIERKDNGLS
jgi:sensor histidine kinase YesM